MPYIGKRKIQDLRTYDIEQFYATLSRTPCGQYVKGEKQELSAGQKKRLLSSTSIHEVHTLLKTAFSYAVEWDLVHKSPLPRDAPKVTPEERAIWDEHTMLAALQTIENPALHLAVHLSMILSLRAGEILGLQPEDIDFGAANGRGTISINKTLQRTDKVALEKTDPSQVYYIFPDQREGSKSSLILKQVKTRKSNRILYLTKPLREELLAWLEKTKQDEQAAPDVSTAFSARRPNRPQDEKTEKKEKTPQKGQNSQKPIYSRNSHDGLPLTTNLGPKNELALGSPRGGAAERSEAERGEKAA